MYYNKNRKREEIMRLTRRRRKKIYKVIGVVAAIGLVVALIITNPFKYIHFDAKPKKEKIVVKKEEKVEEKQEEPIEEKKEEVIEKKEEEKQEEVKKEEIKKEEKKDIIEKKEPEQKDIYYTVTFFNMDGSVIKTATFKSGSVPYYSGENPTYYDDVHYYEFAGWDKSFKAITGNTSYIAQYNITGDVPHSPQPSPSPSPSPSPEPEPDPISGTEAPYSEYFSW